MVKADMTRDYYGDLEVLPTADLSEIKKQFKKLALSYHPDRNPGRESEVTAKFQKIQSAHEVLSDPTERARYDAGRIRTSNNRTGYQGASGVRGNPWSNPAPQWAPPPRPPGARSRPPPPPPASAGAARYSKFSTPKTSTNPTDDGAEARKKTYEAWEQMRTKREDVPPPPQTGSSRSSWKPAPPARDYTKTSARDESNSNSNSYAPPPKSKPGFEEFRANYSPNVSPQRRAQSTGAGNRRFTPATPGGDEPAAPKGAYFTNHKPQQAPEPPPRGPPPPSMNNLQPDAARQNVRPDPLRGFRERNDASEARVSTPYATHGGEKLDPFQDISLNRSKSTRERPNSPGGQVPRTGSHPNSRQPQRSRSYADRITRPTTAYAETPYDSSSSEEEPEIPQTPKPRPFAQPRRTPTGTRKPVPEATSRTENTSKPSLSQFQKWYRDNPGQEPPLNSTPSDGQPPGPGQTGTQPVNESNVYGDPQIPYNLSRFSQSQRHPNISTQSEMFPGSAVHSQGADLKLETDQQEFLNHSRSRYESFFNDVRHPYLSSTRRATTQETVSQDRKKGNSKSQSILFDIHNFPNLFPRADGIVTTPIESAADSLNPFETDHRRLIAQLVNKRRASGTGSNTRRPTNHKVEVNNVTQSSEARPADLEAPHQTQIGGLNFVAEPALLSCLPEKHRTVNFPVPRHSYAQHPCTTEADSDPFNSFSFKVDDSTFAATKHRPYGMKSSSAENINTKFTPEEWEGKFEAGAGYFVPEQKAAGFLPRGRAQSGSRSRGRSPTKARPIDTKGTAMPAHTEEQTPIESPGGTKFTPEEWAQSFKPQTFMPPPASMPPRSRKGRQSSLRTTMGGNAAVFDDSETTSDEKPLFTGRKPPPIITSSPSPDAMEVDTPPVRSTESRQTKTSVTDPETLGQTSPSKRAAPPSQSPMDSALKVEFDDLKLQDLISHLNMPAAPEAPTLPVGGHAQQRRIPEAAYEVYLHEFKAYMSDWDLFTNQFMMHMLARKKENDTFGASRWESDEGLESYRLGLKADKMVLGHWSAAQEHHQSVMKDYAILKEQMTDRSDKERPRKKVY